MASEKHDLLNKTDVTIALAEADNPLAECSRMCGYVSAVVESIYSKEAAAQLFRAFADAALSEGK